MTQSTRFDYFDWRTLCGGDGLTYDVLEPVESLPMKGCRRGDRTLARR
jgi:hypothetical protein